MSSYLVLARKYRPQNFAELIGQEVLVKTLTNAMRNNRLHHGYICCGYTKFRDGGLTIFRLFVVTRALTACRFVVVAKLK